MTAAAIKGLVRVLRNTRHTPISPPSKCNARQSLMERPTLLVLETRGRELLFTEHTLASKQRAKEDSRKLNMAAESACGQETRAHPQGPQQLTLKIRLNRWPQKPKLQGLTPFSVALVLFTYRG